MFIEFAPRRSISARYWCLSSMIVNINSPPRPFGFERVEVRISLISLSDLSDLWSNIQYLVCGSSSECLRKLGVCHPSFLACFSPYKHNVKLSNLPWSTPGMLPERFPSFLKWFADYLQQIWKFYHDALKTKAFYGVPNVWFSMENIWKISGS